MLEVKNLHKIYNNGKRALEVLKGVDLNIQKGEFVAVTGPSGAGKSTLLHILGGLDSPTQGQVIFAQDDIYSLSDISLCKIRNEKIGFVFQFYHLLAEFTVLENVLLPALINYELRVTCLSLPVPALPAGRRQAGGRQASYELRKNALTLLEKVGLSERITHFPSQLSGGEKQRVAIVRGLINNPSLLLCDEPTGNLDSQAGSEIISLIKRINAENQMTVVLVTHNLELAKIADRVYHLKDGILVN